MRRYLAFASSIAIAAAVAAEIAARLSGLADIPLYRADPVLGYIPASRQSGSFLDKHPWVFNDRGMGVAADFHATRDAIVLLGDSVVLGGVWVSQADRLGPQVQALTGRPVWPLAAGSWALTNELRLLRSQPDLMRAGTIVILSNSGDFGAPSVWRSELTHPTRHPWSVAWYALEKKLLAPPEAVDSPRSPAATRLWRAELGRFLASYKGDLVWIMYPKRPELGAPIRPFGGIAAAVAGRAHIAYVGADRRWSSADYRDGIHPSAQGNHVLAAIVADQLAAPAVR